MRKIKIFIVIVLFIILGAALPDRLNHRLNPDVPEGWPQPRDIFKDNPLTDAGFLLGKKLFYDGRLSKDGQFPCSSCHEPRAAFATLDHDFSHGFGDQFTTRNAPALQNLAWQLSYNWDGKFMGLEEQAVSPLTAPNEMAENLDSIITKLKKDKDYPALFGKAFGNKEITAEKLLKALAQFTGSMVSSNSKYDQVMRGEANFNSAEENGYKVFKLHCSACHQEPLFTDNTFRNNGLEADPYLNDNGRMGVTQNKEDSLKFKVPSLRNAGLTSPYMHDGRFSSLARVIEHYTSGIQASETLDPLLKKPIDLTPREKHDLRYFLHTLTDSSFIQNPAYLP